MPTFDEGPSLARNVEKLAFRSYRLPRLKSRNLCYCSNTFGNSLINLILYSPMQLSLLLWQAEDIFFNIKFVDKIPLSYHAPINCTRLEAELTLTSSKPVLCLLVEHHNYSRRDLGIVKWVVLAKRFSTGTACAEWLALLPFNII